MDNSHEQSLGSVIKQARANAGYTQQTLCDETGLSYSTLAKIERGAIKSPSVFTLYTITRALNISLDELVETALPARAGRKRTSRGGVKFVYFDMNGCLVRSAENAFSLLAEESGASLDTVENIFWQYNDDVCRGVRSIDELNTALAERLGIMVDWNRYYLETTESTPGMKELVDWTSSNYKVGILTNTMPNLVDPMLDMGMLPDVSYDAIVDSSEVHALKPEMRIFEIATEMAGCEPHEILLIDDDRPNLVAAGRYGWQTLKFHAFQSEETAAAIRETLRPV